MRIKEAIKLELPNNFIYKSKLNNKNICFEEHSDLLDSMLQPYLDNTNIKTDSSSFPFPLEH